MDKPNDVTGSASPCGYPHDPDCDCEACDEINRFIEYMDDDELPCHTCGGERWVDSVASESGRHGWDPEGPGPCPNCGGTGLQKDCTTF